MNIRLLELNEILDTPPKDCRDYGFNGIRELGLGHVQGRDRLQVNIFGGSIPLENGAEASVKKDLMPRHFALNTQEIAKYQSIMAELLEHTKDLISDELKFVCELASRQVNNDLNITKGVDLTPALIVILCKAWLESSRHPIIVGVTFLEDREKSTKNRPSVKLYEYNGGKKKTLVPPYVRITKDKFKVYLRQWLDTLWLDTLFESTPPGILGTVDFTDSLATQIEAYIVQKGTSFTYKYSAGIGIDHGYYFFDGISPLARFIPFTCLLIVEQVYKGAFSLAHVMPCDHAPILQAEKTEVYPPFDKKVFESGTDALIENTIKTAEPLESMNPASIKKTLLEIEELWVAHPFNVIIFNLCNGDHLKMYGFRTMCHRVIFSRLEGAVYKSGFWLHGLPGSGKSDIIKILRELAGANNFIDISNSAGTFTKKGVYDKSLLSITDTQYIGEAVANLVKEILNRNIIPFGFENVPEIVSDALHCTLIITGNKPPEECGPLYETPEVRGQLIPFCYDTLLWGERMGKDFDGLLAAYLPMFWIWGALSDRSWLEDQVQGRVVINTLEKKGIPTKSVIHQYIDNQLLRPKPAFCATLPYKEPKKKSNKKVTAHDLQCVHSNLGYVHHADLRENFRAWVTKSGCTQQLIVEGGSTEVTSTYMNCLPTKLAALIFSVYNYALGEKKKKRLTGSPGMGLEGISLMTDVVDSRYMLFTGGEVKMSIANMNETMKSDISGILVQPFPFTPMKLSTQGTFQVKHLDNKSKTQYQDLVNKKPYSL